MSIVNALDLLFKDSDDLHPCDLSTYRHRQRKMTLYHFANCLGLAYTPYYLTYKYSGLAEYGAFWKVTDVILTPLPLLIVCRWGRRA